MSSRSMCFIILSSKILLLLNLMLLVNRVLNKLFINIYLIFRFDTYQIFLVVEKPYRFAYYFCIVAFKTFMRQ